MYLIFKRKILFFVSSQVTMKEVTRDAEEAHLAKSEAQQQFKDLEKKVKTLEADMIQLQEDLSASERQRRAAETERDDLAEELANYNSRGSLLSDEKRRLDTR